MLSYCFTRTLCKALESKLAARSLHAALADACTFAGLRIDQHHIRNVDRRFLLRDATLLILLRRALVLLLDVYAFNEHALSLSVNAQDLPALSAVLPCGDFDCVVLLDLHLKFFVSSKSQRSPHVRQLSDHFRCKRNDLHVLTLAKLACDWSENARAPWLALRI